MKKSPLVEEVAYSSNVPGEAFATSHFKIDVDGQEASKIVSLLAIDADYIPLMQMELKEGRNFDRDRPTDPQSGVILNEACISFLGMGDSLVGEYITRQIQILGVLKNGKYNSLHEDSRPVALYFMHKIYRIKARPFWNHWQVLTSFYGNMLTLGSMIIMAVFGAVLLYLNQSISQLFTVLGSIMLVGLIMEATGLYHHARDMQRQGEEGAASFYEQSTRFGKTYMLRNTLLALSIIASLSLLLVLPEGLLAYVLWLGVMLLANAQALIGRALFYVLVIPTTMPGAFFWRNRGFQEHARESGLAEMHQVGILPDTH